MTDSIVEYRSTPTGCVCAHPMEISMMSSSEMKEASSGVPSPLVIFISNNQFWKESGDGTSQSLDTVADEVMDILDGS